MSFWIYITVIIVLYYTIQFILRKWNKQNLAGRTALVTGGGSGIGRRMAHKLAARGCTVVIWDINEENMKKVVKEIQVQGGKAYHYCCNVGDFKSVMEAAGKVKAEVGVVDILVNNAGIVSGKYIWDLTEEMITRTIAVNTLAHMWTAKAFLPDMMSQNKGHIVNIVSAAGIVGLNGLMDYCASKFGAFGASESLRLELKQKKMTGCHTLCVCPYYINTGMFEGVRTRFPFILPILEEEYVAERVLDSIEHFDIHLVLPKIVWISFIARYFPVAVADWMGDFLGITHTMDHFKGRGWQASDPKPKQT